MTYNNRSHYLPINTNLHSCLASFLSHAFDNHKFQITQNYLRNSNSIGIFFDKYIVCNISIRKKYYKPSLFTIFSSQYWSSNSLMDVIWTLPPYYLRLLSHAFIYPLIKKYFIISTPNFRNFLFLRKQILAQH